MKRKLLSIIIALSTLFLQSIYATDDNTIIINADASDGLVSHSDSIKVNNPYTNSHTMTDTWGEKSGIKLGSSAVDGSTNLTCAIIPFQLPAIPNGKTIESVNFKVYVSYARQWTNTNIDLYALPYHANDDGAGKKITSSDYYSGDFISGTGTGIEDDFFVKNVSGDYDEARWEETSTDGQSALKSYIEAQYSAGAVAGDWVFVRLSVDNINMTGAQFYLINGGEDANPSQLTFTYKDASTETFTVTFQGDGTEDNGTAPSDTNSPYSDGSQVTLPGAGSLTKSGSSFAGWSADGGITIIQEGNSFFISENTTFVAQWANGVEVISINSGANDGFVSDPTLVTSNNPHITSVPFGNKSGIKIGKSDVAGNSNSTSAILPFELPVIPEGKEITSASLKVFVTYGREWATNVNIDAYGLPYNSSSLILADDHYAGDYANCTDFGIQDDYFSKNVDGGNLDTERWEELNSTGQASLVEYIFAQYEAGAQAGDYVFVRLSIDNADMPSAHFFMIHGAEDANQPTLNITFEENIPTKVSDKNINTATIFPNPTENNQLTIISGNDNLKDDIRFYSISGQLIKTIDVNSTQQNITINNLDLNKGVYMMRVNYKTQSSVQKVIVQ